MAFPPYAPVICRMLGAALAVSLLASPEALGAERVETGFVEKVHRDDAGEHGYVVYVPRDYSAERASPVMLFLHGAGERGTDGVRQSQVGLGAMIRRWGEFPWIVVFPQAEDTRGPIRSVWADDAPDGRRALAILEEVERSYRTDPQRRVLTGWSMGGRGAYLLAAAHPERWSAVVPIAGWADLDVATRLRDVPLWSFHGTEDTLVSYDEDAALIDAIREAGGAPWFTTMPGRAHYIWRTVYASPAVLEWMSDPSRFAGQSSPPVLNPRMDVELTRDEALGPFVPGLEVHNAVAVRIGPDLFRDLSDVVGKEVAEKPLTGSVPGTTTQSRQGCLTFDVSTSAMSYTVPVREIEVTPTAAGTLRIRVSIANARLVIPRTDVRGLICSASAGRMDVVLGHRRPIAVEAEAVPCVREEQFRLRTKNVSFSIPRDNWYVTRPGVESRSLCLPADRVAESLVEGVYSNRSRIERDFRRSVATAIDEMELELPEMSDDQLLTALWPVPAYRPRVKPRLQQVAVDENGLSVVFGMTVAAIDPFAPRTTPKVVDFQLTPADVGQADLAISAAESLIAPLAGQLIEAGVAHINVLDIPERRYAQFADREILTELIPGLRALPASAEIRTEFYLREPMDLDDTTLACEPNGCFSVFDLQVPHLAAVISVRDTREDAWRDFVEFRYDVTQPVRLQLGREVENGREVVSACNDSPEIRTSARWLGDPPADDRLDIEAATRLFHQSWAVWSDACVPTAIVIPDLTFRGYVRRLDLLEPASRGMSVGFEEPETVISNASELSLVYRTKRADSPWGITHTLPPGEKHAFRVARPLGYESQSGGQTERFEIPPGRDATFQLLENDRLGLELDPLPKPHRPPAQVPGAGG